MKMKTVAGLGLIMIIASLSALAQTFSVIHAFNGLGGDGAFPDAGVTIKGSALYGTTSEGGIMGVSGFGTVYQMTHAGSGWAYTPIVLFPANASGGTNPQARVVFGPDQHLYGTTASGGTKAGGGTVFRLSPPQSICSTIASCLWNEQVLWSFDAEHPSGGTNPGYGDLIWDQQGNIYGPAVEGGGGGFGVIYGLSPSGSGWQENVAYNFQNLPDGRLPYGGLVSDNQGNLWGATSYGGENNYGTIFKLTNVPGVGWQKNTVYNFQKATDGSDVLAGLVMDSSGNFYGAASDGGSGIAGTIFELSPSGNGYTFKVLYSFSGTFHCGPETSLTLDSAGNLYGTTRCGGASQLGTVFKLTNTGNGWTYTSLHDFTGGSDGALPYSNVTIDMDGTLYGTAERGGSLNGDCNTLSPAGCGVVWMIKP